ncbi:hypothetical protein NT04LM_2055 [Listeria monocytogenes FSL F2-208]|nr:hypothetical protein NT04LM_2055 [Listeria monocytogenes FSL F2-208]
MELPIKKTFLTQHIWKELGMSLQIKRSLTLFVTICKSIN